MSRALRFRIAGAAGAIALAAGGALLTPAGAAGVQPILHTFGLVSCSTSSPCQEYDNTAAGSGLKGVSTKGTGLIGVTNFNKLGATNGTAGVSGTDTATRTTKNAGVLGTSNAGIGVSGVSTTNAGVNGVSTASNGVNGESVNDFGVFGTGAEGGVFGQVTGVNQGGITQGGLEGVDATNTNLNAGLLGISVNGTGAVADSQNGVGLFVVGETGAQIDAAGEGMFINASSTALFVNTGNGYGIDVTESPGDVQVPIFTTSGVSGNPFVDAYEAFDSNGTELVRITDTGDVSILGQIFTSGGCSSGCITQNHRTHRVVSYAPTEAEPTREDTGIGQLVAGRAYVQLDPAFVNVIDTRRSYAVLLTPEGDSRGLYVASKSKDGFEVREDMGGSSSLAFDYRVVAKPYGVESPRLPMVTLPQMPRPRPTHAPVVRVRP